jgi:8-amino-7-oxononanoate synthase
MLDFTSALYLGMRHPSRSFRPWTTLTTGVPAALGGLPESRRVAQEIAALQGCERATLGTSTLHLFWDLFNMIAGEQVRIYVDAGVYPIARWGVERAAARGAAVSDFRHHDPDALRQQLRLGSGYGLRPVVVTDGFCPGCGQAAPLAAYRDCMRASGGLLIVDDTQALGIFGRSPGPEAPYGKGGGGMLVAANISGPDVLAVSSLAKGFGAPLAVLAGSNSAVENFELKSQTRMHCSPPSVAALRAAEHALAMNQTVGDALRLRLGRLVARFLKGAARVGYRFVGGLFPVLTLASPPHMDVVALHQQLLRRGIRTVPHWARAGRGARLSFLITARHAPEEIDRAAEALGQVNLRQLVRGVAERDKAVWT